MIPTFMIHKMLFIESKRRMLAYSTASNPGYDDRLRLTLGVKSFQALLRQSSASQDIWEYQLHINRYKSIAAGVPCSSLFEHLFNSIYSFCCKCWLS